MPAVLGDPYTWLSLGVLLVVAVIGLKVTGDRWYDMALRVIGFAAFLIAVRWVGAVEPELGVAVLMAAGGFALVVWSPKLPIGDRKRRSRNADD